MDTFPIFVVSIYLPIEYVRFSLSESAFWVSEVLGCFSLSFGAISEASQADHKKNSPLELLIVNPY